MSIWLAASFGGHLSVFAREPEKVEGGAFLKNTGLVKGEIISPASPVAYNAHTHEAKILRIWQVKAAAVVDTDYTKVTVYQGGNLPEIHAADVVMVLGDTLASTGKAAVAGPIDLSVPYEASFTVLTSALDATTAAVNGIYTLTIGTAPAADDKLTVNGKDYVFAAAAAEGKIAIGADKVATAENLQDALKADNQNFVVKADGAKLVFTQKVAGTGAIPTIAVVQAGEGALVASIATTLAGSASAGGLKVGAFIVQSSSATAGSGKSIYCVPNSLTTEDTVIGDQNTVDIARGPKYVYKNVIAKFFPDIVAAAIPMIDYAHYPELQGSGYIA